MRQIQIEKDTKNFLVRTQYTIYWSTKSLKKAFEIAKLLQASFLIEFKTDSSVVGRNLTNVQLKKYELRSFKKCKE